ncbi:MAG: hypothetical protein DRI89_15245 [Bacteroidetes bacterium]|nr:MAG: hypothetical protein DRI89_15245 [Bacteroidota bacterium]
MKQIFFIVLVLLVVSACGNIRQKKAEKNETSKETHDFEDTKGEELPIVDTTSGNPSGLQSSKKETEADRERKLNLRRARTAFGNGIQYYNKGEMDQAKEAFKLVLEYDPQNGKACYNLGKIYYGFNEKDIALAYYEDAVRCDDKDSASMVGAGLIFFEKGDYNSALEYYNMAIKLAPNYALAFYNRGTLLGYQKNYGGALTDMSKAIEIDPGNSKYYMNRGLANYYLKRNQQACDDWEKAALMGNAEAQKALGIYCKKIEK